jgi:hypothetical protein
VKFLVYSGTGTDFPQNKSVSFYRCYSSNPYFINLTAVHVTLAADNFVKENTSLSVSSLIK